MNNNNIGMWIDAVLLTVSKEPAQSFETEPDPPRWCYVCQDIQRVSTSVNTYPNRFCASCDILGIKTSYNDMVLEPPNTLSGLIRLGVTDGRKLNPAVYRPMHYSWHEISRGEKCMVCFAGGAMAGTLRADSDKDYTPSSFSDAWRNAFWALDYVRLGRYRKAYHLIKKIGTRPRAQEYIDAVLGALPMERYMECAHFVDFNSFSLFLNNVEDVADYLETKGL